MCTYLYVLSFYSLFITIITIIIFNNRVPIPIFKLTRNWYLFLFINIFSVIISIIVCNLWYNKWLVEVYSQGKYDFLYARYYIIYLCDHLFLYFDDVFSRSYLKFSKYLHILFTIQFFLLAYEFLSLSHRFIFYYVLSIQ